MLLDPETLDLVAGHRGRSARRVQMQHADQVKPELFQSVLEVATTPCPDIATGDRATGRAAPPRRRDRGAERDAVGAAGTHPFALCDGQEIVERPRYRELVADLGFIAERELIFGTHVHVGIDSPRQGDLRRRRDPPPPAAAACALLELAVLGGQEHGDDVGPHARLPGLPPQGVPPHYGSWEIYARRVGQMTGSGAIEDYTYLWWDVRPHPNLGTVETRVFDQATRLEDTAALAALTLSLAHRFAELFDEGEPLVEAPYELSTTTRCGRPCAGWRGSWSTSAQGCPVAATEMAERLIAEVEASAERSAARTS